MTELVSDVTEAVATAGNAELAKKDQERDGLPWLGMAINAAVALLVVVVALLAYHQFFVLPNKQRFAMLDIAEILQLKELQVTVGLSQPGVDDKTRGDTFQEISTFAQGLEKAIAEVQEECGCTILVRAAVVKGQGEDLTPLLKQKMGLANVDQATLLRQLKSAKPGMKPEGEK